MSSYHTHKNIYIYGYREKTHITIEELENLFFCYLHNLPSWFLYNVQPSENPILHRTYTYALEEHQPIVLINSKEFHAPKSFQLKPHYLFEVTWLRGLLI